MEHFILVCIKRFIQMYANTVLGVKSTFSRVFWHNIGYLTNDKEQPFQCVFLCQFCIRMYSMLYRVLYIRFSFFVSVIIAGISKVILNIYIILLYCTHLLCFFWLLLFLIPWLCNFFTSESDYILQYSSLILILHGSFLKTVTDM